MKSQLYPELPHIESRLFGRLSAETSQAERDETDSGTSVEIPAFIQDLIKQRCESPNRLSILDPEVGHIVMAEIPDPDLASWLTLLLDKPDGKDGWYAWIVTPDTEYFAPGDYVLDPEELGIDPSATLVQLWNRVRIQSAWIRILLGRLSEQVMASLRAASVEPVPPASIIQSDRNAYRTLYRQAAKKIEHALAPHPDEGIASIASILAAKFCDWAKTTGLAITSTHWVPEPMHGLCDFDALLVQGLFEIQFFEAGDGLVGVRVRARNGLPLTLRLEHDGHPVVQKTLHGNEEETEFVVSPEGEWTLNASLSGGEKTLQLTLN